MSTNKRILRVVFEDYTHGQKKFDQSDKGILLDEVNRLCYNIGQL